METRELYKQKYQAQIHEWTAKLDVLKAQGEKMSVQAKFDAKPRLDTIHAKVEAAKAMMHTLASTTEDTWEEVKKGADQAWTDAKAAIEGAYDAVKASGAEAQTAALDASKATQPSTPAKPAAKA